MKHLLLSVFAVFATICYAAPRPPIEIPQLSGTIQSMVWRDTTQIHREWGDGFSIRQAVPSHYLLILSVDDSVDGPTLDAISSYSRTGYYLDPIMFEKHSGNQVLVIFHSPKREDFREGLLITFRNFYIFADEHAAETRYESLTLNTLRD